MRQSCCKTFYSDDDAAEPPGVVMFIAVNFRLPKISVPYHSQLHNHLSEGSESLPGNRADHETAWSTERSNPLREKNASQHSTHGLLKVTNGLAQVGGLFGMIRSCP